MLRKTVIGILATAMIAFAPQEPPHGASTVVASTEEVFAEADSMEVSTEPAVGAATASHGAVAVGARLVGAAAAGDGVDRL